MVIGPKKWSYPKIVRFTKKVPKLKSDQVAFRLNIEYSNDILKPPTIAVSISQQNVIRPVPNVTEG